MAVSTRAGRARIALLAGVLLLSLSALGVTPAAAHRELPPPSGRDARIERVIEIAKRQIGDPWVWGRRGPAAFDCIGLVYYAFKEAGALKLIGGEYRTIGALRAWAENHAGDDRRNPRRGDLVVWGGTKHIGIYLGRGLAISALVSGVRIHRVKELTDPFTAYLHLARAS